MSRNARIGAAVGLLVLVGLVVWLVTRQQQPNIEVISDETPTKQSAVDSAKTDRVAALRSSVAGGDGGVPAVVKPRDPAVVAEFGWGSGEGQLGKTAPDEANPEGPMSLTVDALGNVWILDQVNNRLVKVDKNGKPLGTMPIPLQAAQDVVTTPDGKTLVLDRLVDKAVAVLGPDGKQLGEIPLEGKGLDEGGASTGLFTDGEDVYVEREHGDSIRIGDTSGKANKERPEVPGRPAQDGRTFLTAGIIDGASGTVGVTAIDRQTQQHRFTRQLVIGSRVMGLNALDADRSGIIYLGVIVEAPGSTAEVPMFGVNLLCLDPLDGRPLAASRLPHNSSPEETFREMQVLPEGGVIYLVRSEQGAQVVRYQCGQ
ncbi:MAG: hypothetical protein ACO1OB_30790 [Archangium sp.]